MTVWILAFLLLILGAGLGRALGMLRVFFGILGALVSYRLALPLGDMMASGLSTIGVTSITWTALLPPVLVFLGVNIVFFAISQAIQLKVDFYYRYKVADEQRVLWERLNAQTGLCLGLVFGVVYLGIISSAVYSIGYLTVQVQSPKVDSTMLSLINRTRADLRSTGLERLAAAMDHVPANYYHAADVMGLIYNNPDLQPRLFTYPLFLSLVETPEIKQVITNADVVKIFKEKGDFFEFLDHTNLTAALKNKFIATQIKSLDVSDLHTFLETGKSPKFDSTKAIGQWDIYVPATVIEVGKMHPKLTIPEKVLLRRALISYASDISVTMASDGQIFLKGPLENFDVLNQLLGGVLPKTPAPKAGSPVQNLATGNWKKDGDNYTVVIRSASTELAGQLEMLRDDSFVIRLANGAMVFTRVQ